MFSVHSGYSQIGYSTVFCQRKRTNICLHVFSFELWCPLRFPRIHDVRFVFTPIYFVMVYVSSMVFVLYISIVLAFNTIPKTHDVRTSTYHSRTPNFTPFLVQFVLLSIRFLCGIMLTSRACIFTFLAHLAKGDVSILPSLGVRHPSSVVCRPSSVVCLPLTVHILIFSSEPP